MSDDELIAYLTGDDDVPLDPGERATLDGLRPVLGEPALWVEPGPDLQERIVEAIAAAGATPPLHAVTSPPVVDDLATRRSSRRLRYVVLGVAAAVLLAIGVAIGVTRDGSRPMEYAASLTATKLAPGASGDVTLSQTRAASRIRLPAAGLPRLDNGRYYEAWLKNAAGIPVPIGTFNEPTDVTLWAGVAPSSFPTLTITRQQADGNQASSGQVVLVGVTHRAR